MTYSMDYDVSSSNSNGQHGLSDGFRAQSYPRTPFQPAEMCPCVIISQIKREESFAQGF